MKRNSRSGFGSVLWLVLCACGSSEAVPEPAGAEAGGTRSPTTVSSPATGAPSAAGAPESGRGGSNSNSSATAGSRAPDAPSAGGASGGSGPASGQFSFFVTSLKAMQELSSNQHGFGGDLRFGETGDGAGLRGADKICATIADKSMPGAGKKTWRAFLSATKGGPSGGPVHAIDRVGEGPWYDRVGRVVALNKADLMQVRPASADALIKNDLPNEDGVPNHNPDGTGEVDNHDILTGTNDKGQLYADDPHVTCNDWTNSVPDVADAPRVGHSWPRGGGRGGRPGRTPREDSFAAAAGSGAPPGGGNMGGGNMGGANMGGMGRPGGGGGSGENWMSALTESGCGAEASIIEMGPPDENNPTVGSGGGYGGIYCFALTP